MGAYQNTAWDIGGTYYMSAMVSVGVGVRVRKTMTGISTEGMGTQDSLRRLPRGNGASAKTEQPGRGRWGILKTLRIRRIGHSSASCGRLPVT